MQGKKHHPAGNGDNGGQLTALGSFYVKYVHQLIPGYSLLPLLSCFAWNILVYVGAGRLMAGARHYDLTTAFDRAVPFSPWWVYIYLGCYAFWAANYILTGREGREHCYRFVFADILSRTICFGIFILLPTTNVRPEVSGNTLADMIMRFVYDVDAPVNLFPSIHCLISWLCYIGIRKSKKVPSGYKVFSCVFALLIMASTQLTKQHYIVDVAGGVALAQISWLIACRMDYYWIIEKPFRWIERKAFGVYLE